MDWLNRIIYIAFGVLLGAGLCWLWGGQELNSSKDTVLLDRTFDRELNKESAFDIEKVVAQTVRKEIVAQFASLKFPQQTCLPVAAHMPNDKEGEIDSRQAEIIYESADHKLDEVIAAGGFNSLSAKEFIDYTNTLPSDKALELRLKHVRAVNDGLISSPLLPEQVMDMR